MFIEELKTRELPEKQIEYINREIDQLNTIKSSDKKYVRQVRKSQADIIRHLKEEIKLVPKNYYRNLWLAVGMAAFGIPMGVAYGAALDNMAFIGVGIPLGMVIGIAIGVSMDKKAAKEGNQLNWEQKN